MRLAIIRTETTLAAMVLLLAAAAVLGPPLAQHAHYHAFADQAAHWGLPHALDVLSNLPFALVAAFGAWRLRNAEPGALGPMERAMACLLFAGLLLTALGSSWYHLDPTDAGLVIDRAAMAIAFAGLLGLAAARVSDRAAAALGLTALLLAPVTLQVWMATGNLWPWAVLQGGAMLLVLGLALARPARGALAVRWTLVLAVYALAKAFEAGDHAIWHLSGEWVSGHSLKHLVAALAAWPVVAALGALPCRQNASKERATAP